MNLRNCCQKVPKSIGNRSTKLALPSSAVPWGVSVRTKSTGTHASDLEGESRAPEKVRARKTLPPVLIVGLGNYNMPKTRHNLGRMTVTQLAKEWASKGIQSESADWVNSKAVEGLYRSFHITSKDLAPGTPQQKRSKMTNTDRTENNSNNDGVTEGDTRPEWERKAILFKPLTYMNVNGVPLLKATRLWQIPHGQILVLHDDLDVDLGKLKVKNGGSAYGHNGVRSIISTQKTMDFSRIRLGISRPENEKRKAIFDYVLERFSPQELKIVENNLYPLVFQRLSDILSRDVLFRPPVTSTPKKRGLKEKHISL